MANSSRESETQTPSGKHLRLRAYLSQWWDELAHLDGPTLRSLKGLLTCPGQLAVDECDRPTREGASSKTVHPIRLYLTINIIFFFTSPWLNTEPSADFQFNLWQMKHGPVVQMQPALETWLIDRIESSGFDDTSYRVILDHTMSSQRGAVVFVFIPILGLASFLVYRRRRPFLVEHLILGTHLTSFFLASLLIVGLGARLTLLLPKAVTVILLVFWVLAWALWLSITFYRSVRAFHEVKNRWLSILLASWSLSALFAGTFVYLWALFIWTLFSLRGLQLVGS